MLPTDLKILFSKLTLMDLSFDASKIKSGDRNPEVGFWRKKILKQRPDQNLTNGKIVLELLKYAKSVFKSKSKF